MRVREGGEALGAAERELKALQTKHRMACVQFERRLAAAASGDGDGADGDALAAIGELSHETLDRLFSEVLAEAHELLEAADRFEFVLDPDAPPPAAARSRSRSRSARLVVGKLIELKRILEGHGAGGGEVGKDDDGERKRRHR